MPVFIPVRRHTDYHEHPYENGELFKGCPACERKLEQREARMLKKENDKSVPIDTEKILVPIILLLITCGLAIFFVWWDERRK